MLTLGGFAEEIVGRKIHVVPFHTAIWTENLLCFGGEGEGGRGGGGGGGGEAAAEGEEEDM